MNNIMGGRGDGQKLKKTVLGGSVPSIFVETVVINYFPHSFRLMFTLFR